MLSRGPFASEVVVSLEECRPKGASRTPLYMLLRLTSLRRRGTVALSIGGRRGCYRGVLFASKVVASFEECRQKWCISYPFCIGLRGPLLCTGAAAA